MTKSVVKKENKFDKEIDHILNEMRSMDVGSEEYKAASGNLKLLMEVKKENNFISNEALLMAATNIGGILLILNFERMGVITSKAISLIGKGSR